MRKGIFITLEGGEGCGKSTQIKRLRRYLKTRGRRVFLTREPGGTRAGDAIRKILLDKKQKGMNSVCETLLYMASRAELVKKVIQPRLAKGEIVLCDRWLDSTVAYQGFGEGVSIDWIRSLGREIMGELSPVLSLYLDLPVKVGLKRTTSGRRADRVESKKLSFHRKVRRGFLWIAKKEPRRFKRIIVSAGDPVSAVHEKIKKEVDRVIR